MSAPDELRQLADRLCSTEPLTYGDINTIAVALRHHANLIDAIGDPDELRTMVAGLVRRVAGIADAAAAVSPPPTPTCPTCGWPVPFEDWQDGKWHHCSDSWHQATT